jgi:hypothetical protein
VEVGSQPAQDFGIGMMFLPRLLDRGYLLESIKIATNNDTYLCAGSLVCKHKLGIHDACTVRNVTFMDSVPSLASLEARNLFVNGSVPLGPTVVRASVTIGARAITDRASGRK